MSKDLSQLNKSIINISKKFSNQEALDLADNYCNYILELIELLYSHIEDHGYRKIKIQIYDYLVTYPEDKKYVQETYRLLKRVCYKLNVNEMKDIESAICEEIRYRFDFAGLLYERGFSEV